MGESLENWANWRDIGWYLKYVRKCSWDVDFVGIASELFYRRIST